ncbi:asparagine synthase-related protein [Thioalkalivibrio sp. ALE12]|uniref:asparagine synthase-related protein n=1 Tax=Thioalkalivibrio sp. ALE12 TaxID=1158170 RepID=UPI0003A6E3C5|nr:asparagine synthase-related protein [Thioalkalivibrio sp. ALE12]
MNLTMGVWSWSDLLDGGGPEGEYGVRLNPSNERPRLEDVSTTQDGAQYQLACGAFIGARRLPSGDFLLIPDLLGLRPIYFTESFVADSFLELLEAVKDDARGGLHLDAHSVMHFLEFGYPPPGLTILKGIYRTCPGEVVIIGPSGVKRLTANENPLGMAASSEFSESMTYLAERMSALVADIRHPASVDVTGGGDSRVLAAFSSFSPTVKEASCSYSTSEADEIRIGKEVSRKVGLDYHFVCAPGFNSLDDVEASFEYVDGQGDILDALRHRKMQVERASRGIEVSLSGIGGELFKDFWWLQDFPWYRRKRPDLDRLFRLRVNSSPMRIKGLSSEFSSALEVARSSCRERISGVGAKGRVNTEAYDRIYYWEKMANVPVPFVVGGAKHGVAVCPVLLDPSLVSCGYGLPRRMRFLDRVHRRWISASPVPGVGAIPTTAGTTLKAGWAGEMTDGLGWFLNKVKRLGSKMVERATGRVQWRKTPNQPDSVDKLIEIGDELGVIKELGKYRVVEEGVESLKDLDRARAGRFCCLGLTLKALGSDKRSNG